MTPQRAKNARPRGPNAPRKGTRCGQCCGPLGPTTLVLAGAFSATRLKRPHSRVSIVGSADRWERYFCSAACARGFFAMHVDALEPPKRTKPKKPKLSPAQWNAARSTAAIFSFAQWLASRGTDEIRIGRRNSRYYVEPLGKRTDTADLDDAAETMVDLLDTFQAAALLRIPEKTRSPR